MRFGYYNPISQLFLKGFYLVALLVLSLPKSLFAQKPTYEAPYSPQNIVIDGKANEAIWAKAPWAPIDQNWIGEMPTTADFKGRYKALWRSDALYLLVEITDDSLYDGHPDGLDRYWDDDCVEIFIDEDASGGDHLYSHNAWAYHVALDGKVTDFSPKIKAAAYYNDHIETKRTCNGKTCLWEMAITIYGDEYQDGKDNLPVALHKMKKMGFAVAYCDNDGSPERENFMGSVPVAGPDKNLGYKTADIFGRIVLK